MGTNTAAPNGLVPAQLQSLASPTGGQNIYKIKNGYASNIAIGDLVKTLTGASQGYIGLATLVDTAVLGVFVGLAGSSISAGIPGAAGGGYYDTNTQTYSYGRNGAYLSTITPATGVDLGAAVIDDPMAVFKAQLIGGPWVESYRGRNINWTTATNGAPNAAGISVLSLDGTTISNDPTLPFRIVGLAGVSGGPQDPANTNPWILVKLNTPELASPAGI